MHSFNDFSSALSLAVLTVLIPIVRPRQVAWSRGRPTRGLDPRQQLRRQLRDQRCNHKQSAKNKLLPFQFQQATNQSSVGFLVYLPNASACSATRPGLDVPKTQVATFLFEIAHATASCATVQPCPGEHI